MIEINNKKLCESCFSETDTAEVCPCCGYNPSEFSPDPMVLPMGTKLDDKIIIGRVMGKGGFGITYLGYDLRMDKTIAVKEYYPNGISYRAPGSTDVSVVDTKSSETFESGAEKFYTEAQMVSQFNGNPNIVSVYDYFRANSTVYLIMEYINGITLKNYVKRHGVLTDGQALYVMDKIVAALSITHSAGVLHRDISPDNIMLCGDGKVKLIDFGAARQILAESSSNLTVVMKPGYTPIEQYTKKGKQGAWTDIYSLGVSMYYALTRIIIEDPYARMDNDEEFDENKHGIDESLWAILKKCTMINATDRYGSAIDLRKALKSVSSLSAEKIELTEGDLKDEPDETEPTEAHSTEAADDDFPMTVPGDEPEQLEKEEAPEEKAPEDDFPKTVSGDEPEQLEKAEAPKEDAEKKERAKKAPKEKAAGKKDRAKKAPKEKAADDDFPVTVPGDELEQLEKEEASEEKAPEDDFPKTVSGDEPEQLEKAEAPKEDAEKKERAKKAPKEKAAGKKDRAKKAPKEKAADDDFPVTVPGDEPEQLEKEEASEEKAPEDDFPVTVPGDEPEQLEKEEASEEKAPEDDFPKTVSGDESEKLEKAEAPKEDAEKKERAKKAPKEKASAKKTRGNPFKNRKLIAAICAAAAVVIAAVLFGVSRMNRSSFTEGDGPVDEIMIKGKKYSTDITSLDLSGKKLKDKDIADLRFMTKLEQIDLSGNRLTDISVLENIGTLIEINASGNKISDISFLRDMRQVKTIVMNDNQISDISVLSNRLTIEKVWLNDNNVTDISPLVFCSDLVELGLNNCNIGDISALEKKSKLELLSLSNCGITDVSALRTCRRIRELHLGGNDIADTSPLNYLNFENDPFDS